VQDRWEGGNYFKDRKQSIIMKVGQTVYLRPDKLADGLTIKQGVKTRTVEKVGRKYVYLIVDLTDIE